jgi:hypothetical protein
MTRKLFAILPYLIAAIGFGAGVVFGIGSAYHSAQVEDWRWACFSLIAASAGAALTVLIVRRCIAILRARN